MHRRYRTVALAALLSLFASSSGQASLECDGFYSAGFYDMTFYEDGFYPEDACGAGGSTGDGGLLDRLKIWIGV